MIIVLILNSNGIRTTSQFLDVNTRIYIRVNTMFILLKYFDTFHNERHKFSRSLKGTTRYIIFCCLREFSTSNKTETHSRKSIVND